jgi:hypothetical protein
MAYPSATGSGYGRRGGGVIVKKVAAWALVPVGLLGAVLLFPLASGQEGLTRWASIEISNKNAMYFMVPVLIALVYSGYYRRQTTLRGKIIVEVVMLASIVFSVFIFSHNPLLGGI